MGEIQTVVQAAKEVCTAASVVCWLDAHEGAGVWFGGLASLAVAIIAVVGPVLDRRDRARIERHQRLRLTATRMDGDVGLKLIVGYQPTSQTFGVRLSVEALSPDIIVMAGGRCEGRWGPEGEPSRRVTAIDLSPSTASNSTELVTTVFLMNRDAQLTADQAKVRLILTHVPLGTVLVKHVETVALPEGGEFPTR